LTREQIKQRLYSSCPLDHKCEKECTRWSLFEQISDTQFKIVPCPCAEKLDRHVRYSEAGIERAYWDFTVNDIDSDFDQSVLDEYVNVFMEKTDKCIDSKVSILFYGSSGSGTTSLAVLILKQCLDCGYKGKVFTANELINKMYSAKISDLYDYDILVVDGVDKLNKESLKQDLSSLLSDVMDKRAVIFTSLIPSIKFVGYHSDFINRIKNIPNVKLKDINFRELHESRFEVVKES
jgi:DNA replication protein DnaC